MINHTCNNIRRDSLGTCWGFQEKQLRADRYNLFEKSPKSKTANIIIRGGAQKFIEKAERYIHYAFMVVKRVCKAT